MHGCHQTNSIFRIVRWLIASLIIICIISCQKNEDIIAGPSIHSPDGTQKSLDEYYPDDHVDLIITGTSGSVPMTSFWILKNGSQTSLSDYWVNGSFPTNSTIILQGSERFSFTYSIRLFLPDSENSSTTFRFYVEDDGGIQDFIEYTFSIGMASPVILYSGKLYNANGSGAVGGIDLSTGASVHYTDTIAEIRNMGNVNDQWKLIRPVNGAEIKTSQIDFATVKYAEEIQSAFNFGVTQSMIEAREDLVFVLAIDEIYYLVEVQKLVEGEVQNQDYIELVIKH